MDERSINTLGLKLMNKKRSDWYDGSPWNARTKMKVQKWKERRMRNARTIEVCILDFLSTHKKTEKKIILCSETLKGIMVQED